MIWIIIIVVVLITLGVLTFLLPELNFTRALESSQVSGPWDLSKGPTRVPASNQNIAGNFLSNQKSMFRIFYYVKGMPRTGNAVDSVDVNSNYDQQTNTYKICTLSQGATCTHPGFWPLVSFGSDFKIELLQAPDASRPGLAKTQLVIKTASVTRSTTTNYIETFTLPDFPLQKWIMLTVSREGSRFDVYYNNQLQASIKTTNVPSLSATDITVSEGTGIGQAQWLMSATNSIIISDVAKDFSLNTDTKGQPLQQIIPSFTGISLCPSGNCFKGPSVRPANPLVAWQTSY
jgi:hypothetical protein